jgi:3-hydroxyacyl-[acyl-carrier-protein] dehydratase
MDIQKIIQLLPHRYPFLLVDKVLSYELDKHIIAIKNVTINEEFFQGHFPAKPVMPGVLIIEALAQSAGILAYQSTEINPEESLFYLGAISDVRFKRMVIPGDQLILKVNILKRRKNVWRFACEAFVEDELACSAQMTCMDGKIE